MHTVTASPSDSRMAGYQAVNLKTGIKLIKTIRRVDVVTE